MNAPLVSVILPLYNEPVNFAQDAIQSILNQSYENLEIIIILDNPENNSLLRFIHNFKNTDSRIRLLINEQNLGLPETLNRGIEYSTGTYIARMDGDDISHLTRIQEEVSYLQKHPQIDLVGCNTEVIDEQSTVIGNYINFSWDPSQRFMLKWVGSNLIHPTWVGKRELFKKLKYRNFKYCEDYDFLLRAYAANYKFHNLKKILLSYRIVQHSIYSISREKAYEQAINSRIARKLFHKYLNNRGKEYPDIPPISYDERQAKTYQNVIIKLTLLRTALKQRKFLTTIRHILNISYECPKALFPFAKSLTIKSALAIIDRFIKE